MPICPQAFLTGQPEVVCQLRGSVLHMFEGFCVLDEVLTALDAVEPNDDEVKYLAAACKAMDDAYDKSMLAFRQKLAQPLTEQEI